MPGETEGIADGDGPSSAEVTGTTGGVAEGFGTPLAALSPTKDGAVACEETSSRPTVGATEGAVVDGVTSGQGDVPLVEVKSDGSGLGVEDGDTMLNGVVTKRRVKIETCSS